MVWGHDLGWDLINEVVGLGLHERELKCLRMGHCERITEMNDSDSCICASDHPHKDLEKAYQ